MLAIDPEPLLTSFCVEIPLLGRWSCKGKGVVDEVNVYCWLPVLSGNAFPGLSLDSLQFLHVVSVTSSEGVGCRLHQGVRLPAREARWNLQALGGQGRLPCVPSPSSLHCRYCCCCSRCSSLIQFRQLRLWLFCYDMLWRHRQLNEWISCSPMLQRRVYHSRAAIQRKLYVLGGNDLDYNNDRILVSHTDSYNMDTDQWTHCNFNLLTGQNESGVAVHNGRVYLVGGYSIWTNEPLAFIQVLDVSREGKEEVFYGPTLPFASNGIAACFLPAPYFTCPNLQTLQVPHHRIGTI
ncbi:kelch-like protein 32 [Dipodomys spectabilis]|uniref:kelch-like protein 32 n=1 Tax=Dipodomys spectabilis TaxID=105255 RepID=UPI001C547BD9|nr:kelch-like protein 32 [Dipodomys spectabilis]